MDALAYACKYGHVGVVAVLVEAGAKLTGRSGDNGTRPLGFAATYGHYAVAEFLLDQKARANSHDNFRRTSLHLACRNGHAEIASLLLQRCARINEPDSHNLTPLHYAAAYGWSEIVSMLLKLDADTTLALNGQTALEVAVLKQHYSCVKLFLEETEVNVNA